MGGDWEIRVGVRDDLPELESLWRAMYDHHREVSVGSMPLVAADERWPARLRAYHEAFDAGKALLLIGEAQGNAVGFAFSTLQEPDPIFVSGSLAELETLVVAPDRRGEGLGEELARRSLAALGERGVETVKVVVVAGNEGALRFYERLGIEPSLVELLAPIPTPPPSGR